MLISISWPDILDWLPVSTTNPWARTGVLQGRRHAHRSLFLWPAEWTPQGQPLFQAPTHQAKGQITRANNTKHSWEMDTSLKTLRKEGAYSHHICTLHSHYMQASLPFLPRHHNHQQSEGWGNELDKQREGRCGGRERTGEWKILFLKLVWTSYLCWLS